MAEDPGRSSIKITDKRHFGMDGSRRQPDQEQVPGHSSGERTTGSRQGLGFTRQPEESQEGEGLPAVDFTALVLSFRTSALVHLGLINYPATGEGAVNIDEARQMIDILSLLQQKTMGNLNEEEHRLLEQVLYELRLHFVNSTAAGSRR